MSWSRKHEIQKFGQLQSNTDALPGGGDSALSICYGRPNYRTGPHKVCPKLDRARRKPLYELGWRPPTTPTTLASLVAMLIPMQATTGETIVDALTLSEDSLKAAFVGQNVTTGEVADTAVYAVSKPTGALESLESILHLLSVDKASWQTQDMSAKS